MPEETPGQPPAAPADRAALGFQAPDPPAASSTPEIPTALLKARERRQALLRHRQARRPSSTQQWVFVLVALAVALAWIFGREACTRTLYNTYGTIAGAQDATSTVGSSDGGKVGDEVGDDDW